MKKSKLKELIKEHILRETTKPQSISGDGPPPQYFPKGTWTVKNKFRISPGGGWAIGFQKGSLLRSDGRGGLEESKDGGETWTRRRPPIQDTNILDFHRYSRYPDQRNMWNSIVNNIE